MPQPSITKIGLKITYIKFHSNFSGANESESHSEAPFNLFQAPLTTSLGSLFCSTPLQNSLISIKKSQRAGECLPHSLNARAPFSIRWSPGCLMFTVGIPWKVVFWYWDRFQFIFLSFVAMTLHVIRIEGPTCLATSFCSTAHSVVIWTKIYTVQSTSWRSSVPLPCLGETFW